MPAKLSMDATIGTRARPELMPGRGVVRCAVERLVVFCLSVAFLGWSFWVLSTSPEAGYSLIKLGVKRWAWNARSAVVPSWGAPPARALDVQPERTFFWCDVFLHKRPDGSFLLDPRFAIPGRWSGSSSEPGSDLLDGHTADGVVGLEVVRVRKGGWAVTREETEARLVSPALFDKSQPLQTSILNYRGYYPNIPLPESSVWPQRSQIISCINERVPMEFCGMEVRDCLERLRLGQGPIVRPLHVVRSRWMNVGAIVCVVLALLTVRGAALAATLPVRALIDARRRARLGRCWKCGYDRAGLAEGAACPECGTMPA